jgi:hypothetical protein
MAAVLGMKGFKERQTVSAKDRARLGPT